MIFIKDYKVSHVVIEYSSYREQFICAATVTDLRIRPTNWRAYLDSNGRFITAVEFLLGSEPFVSDSMINVIRHFRKHHGRKRFIMNYYGVK